MELKKLFFATLLLSFCLSFASGQENSKPFVIPEIKEWKGDKGFFKLTKDVRIAIPENSIEIENVAKLFADDCHTMFGFRPEIVKGKGRKGDIVFNISSNTDNEEAYLVNIACSIHVSASHVRGIYHATRTILQIAEQSESLELPMGRIKDFPEYAIRGMMIDCGRKFIPMKYLEDLVKMMAYYKLNTLQVHLNDNAFKGYFQNDWDKTYAAFRLESEVYPGLAARDGHYTKGEFINFQKKSENVFVEIIPEIDVPAHSLAFSQYNPAIGSKEYGSDHLDLFKPETYKFLDELFKEYLEGNEPVFRGPRVHIGTDEYSNKDQEVVEKFREFTDYYIRYIESFGKQAVIWGALTHADGITTVKSSNVIMNAWYNGYADPLEMIRQGYKLISIPDGLVYIVPAAGYYNDYLDIKSLYENWTPANIGSVVVDSRHPSLLGGMFAVWNDHVGNGISVKDIHHRIYPAMQTLSTKMWSGEKVSFDFSLFDNKRLLISEAPGVNHLGRIGRKKGLVYELLTLTPEFETPYSEIGYNYSICFDIEGGKEEKGTLLFSSPDAKFYLSDPVTGMMGFSRDGYLNSFKYRVMPGETASIRVSGNNKVTKLYVNGKLFEELGIVRRDYIMNDNQKPKHMYYVQTLVFPLEKAGKFNSRITNFKVYSE